MGLSLSRYRILRQDLGVSQFLRRTVERVHREAVKKPTVAEQLKKIEDGLQKIEDYKRSTERKQKRTVASVVLYGAALYVIACIIIFVWYLPDSSLVRLGLLIPLVLVPFVIYWTKLLVSKYFSRKMVRANDEYDDLKRKKTEIIDTVMETETFNKAKEILAKYAPEKLEKKVQELNFNAQVGGLKNSQSPNELRKRNLPATNPTTNAAKITEIVPKPMTVANMRSELKIGGPPRVMNSSFGPQMAIPKPMFNKERSFSDKLIEYIVGDGPSYRYALICKNCSGHNGMALKEEFLYTSFKCCYCMFFNPARSQRPTAPRIPSPPRPLPGPCKYHLHGDRVVSVPDCELNRSKVRDAYSVNAIKPKLAVKGATLREIHNGPPGVSDGSESEGSSSKVNKSDEKELPEPVPLNEFLEQIGDSEGPPPSDRCMWKKLKGTHAIKKQCQQSRKHQLKKK